MTSRDRAFATFGMGGRSVVGGLRSGPRAAAVGLNDEKAGEATCPAFRIDMDEAR